VSSKRTSEHELYAGCIILDMNISRGLQLLDHNPCITGALWPVPRFSMVSEKSSAYTTAEYTDIAASRATG